MDKRRDTPASNLGRLVGLPNSRRNSNRLATNNIPNPNHQQQGKVKTHSTAAPGCENSCSNHDIGVSPVSFPRKRESILFLFFVIPNLIGNPGVFSEVFPLVKRQFRGILLSGWLKPVRIGSHPAKRKTI